MDHGVYIWQILYSTEPHVHNALVRTIPRSRLQYTQITLYAKSVNQSVYTANPLGFQLYNLADMCFTDTIISSPKLERFRCVKWYQNCLQDRIVSYRSRRRRLLPLCLLLSKYWITVLYKLFVTCTSVSSSGNITTVVIINVLTTPASIHILVFLKLLTETELATLDGRLCHKLIIIWVKMYFRISHLQFA